MKELIYYNHKTCGHIIVAVHVKPREQFTPITHCGDLEYVGELNEILSLNKMLKHTNQQLEFQLRQKLIS